jgi:hypothetical protein
MDVKIKSMAQKRARHYPETKTVIAVSMIVFGIVSAFCLIVLWPQQFIVTMFNSRLAHRLIIDDQDYYTCSKDYQNFVISEPDSSYNMVSFYLFTVLNGADVIEKGYEPKVEEKGPFAFVKNSYKYDIYFDPVDSQTVTFKEYSFLTEVTNPNDCVAMYYRMEKNYLESNPCADGACECKSSTNTSVTVINPLFLKVMWHDTPFELLAHYSMESFRNVKSILDEPFTEAVKASLVPNALKEVYQFRLYMQSLKLIDASISSLINQQGFTLKQITTQTTIYSQCGLSSYGISTCPFTPYSLYLQQQASNASIKIYPPLTNFFNVSYPFSILNQTNFAQWIAITWYHGFIEFNSVRGFTTIDKSEIAVMLANVQQNYGESVFGTSVFSKTQTIALSTAIRAMAKFISQQYINQVPLPTALVALVRKEWQYTSQKVICSPTNIYCTWQYGYMRKYENSTKIVNNDLMAAIIDLSTILNTNPNNVYQDSNAAPFYNAYLYCSKVLPANASFKLQCTDLDETFNDALENQPAALWAAEHGISTVNFPAVVSTYLRNNASYRESYFSLSCNISTLIQRVYREQTEFHDQYVIRYINKFKDPKLIYNFTVGNWSDLGIAQWAGGFITQAIMNVRTISHVYRNGMWRIGDSKYYDLIMEYSSWAVIQGYPQAWLYSIPDARLLLDTLARNDQVGVDFRRHIMYLGSSFIGDDTVLVNEIGRKGEVTFMTEVNFADFTCPGTITEEACELLNVNFTSSTEECAFIESLYKLCTREQLFNDNLWVNDTSCVSFETTTSAPTTGIPCNEGFIYGHSHPYTKSRGNIIYTMIYAFTLYTTLSAGLWCESIPTCDYSFGGMFTTATAKKLLFEGYTEPSILKYYDLKYSLQYGMSIECVNEPYDECGVKSFSCDKHGIKMKFPHYDKTTNEIVTGKTHDFVMNYGETPNDEYFAEHIMYNRVTNEMLWPFARNSSLAVHSQNEIAKYSEGNDTYNRYIPRSSALYDQYNPPTAVVKILNPFWQGYAAWNSNQTEFLKYYQCLSRFLNGKPNLFNSCNTVLYTGRDTLNKSLTLKYYRGNDTIYPFGSEGNSINVNSSLYGNQFPMYEWAGFFSYPYTYDGLVQGVDFYTFTNPYSFSDLSFLHLTLSQETLIYQFERVLPLTLPLDTGTVSYPVPKEFKVTIRRFVEDAKTWQYYKTMGVPNDSYGLSYEIPIGMADLTRFADFPVFAGMTTKLFSDLFIFTRSSYSFFSN